jgi:hypothetical protein
VIATLAAMMAGAVAARGDADRQPAGGIVVGKFAPQRQLRRVGA